MFYPFHVISFLINRTELDLLHSHLSDSATVSCLSEKNKLITILTCVNPLLFILSKRIFHRTCNR